MRAWVIGFLTVGVLGCGSSSNGAGPSQGGGDAGDGEDSAGDADNGTTPTWTAFASRGTDSRWGVPLAYASKEATFIAFSGSQYPGGALAGAGTFSLDPATGTWTKLDDVNPPNPRYCGCTTYLPDQDQVLLVGGQAGEGPLPPGAWTLDLATSTWTAVSGPLPTGVIGCTSAYMANIHKAVVFGGASATEATSDTWVYDPVAASFAQLSPAAHPTGRADSTGAYDPGEGGRMLIFAGTSDEVDATGHDNDLWAFDGTTWTQLEATGGPPSVRRVAAGGFDAVRRRWVIFGGTDETVDRGDLWMLDVGSLVWTQLSKTAPASARGFASAGYDPTSDSYIVIGGLQQPAGTRLSDGWKLELR
jgi:Galactose oxidase, central domain